MQENEQPTHPLEDEPEWVYEMFFKFSLRYGQAWESRMPTDYARQAMKAIYMTALKNFTKETIIKAIDESLVKCPYPDLTKLVELAETFARTGRYECKQLPYEERKVVYTRMPQEIRDKLGLKRK